MKLQKAGIAVVVTLVSLSMTAIPAAASLAYASNVGPLPEHVASPIPPDDAACDDANAQATEDQNATLWLLGGCVVGVLAILAAQVLEITPPASALLGKDEAYVASYTDCYESAAKKIRTKKSITGCVIGGLAGALLWTILYATAVDNSLRYY
jgi:hypothetical protein